MAKPYFPGDSVTDRSTRIRSYANGRVYKATPKPDPKKMEIPGWVYRLIVFIILIMTVLWFFFASPFFTVKTIQINGQTSPETRATINQLKGKNIFLIGAKKAEDNLTKEAPGIKEIKVLRGIPSTVVVNLVERKPAVVWVTQGKAYLVDKDGYLYKQDSDPNLPKINDEKNLPVSIGQRISSTSFISFINDLTDELTQKTSLATDGILIPETTYQIEVVTKNGGPHLKIDTTRDLNSQLEAIKYVLDHNSADAKNYIDVRVPGLAYVK